LSSIHRSWESTLAKTKSEAAEAKRKLFLREEKAPEKDVLQQHVDRLQHEVETLRASAAAKASDSDVSSERTQWAGSMAELKEQLAQRRWGGKRLRFFVSCVCEQLCCLSFSFLEPLCRSTHIHARIDPLNPHRLDVDLAKVVAKALTNEAATAKVALGKWE